MQTKTCIFSIILLFFLSINHALSSPPPPITPATICSYTPFPSFCRSTIPADNKSATIHDYGRYSVQHSLKMTNKFLSLVNRYLRQRRRFGFPQSTVLALQDCQSLASLTRDFLSNAIRSIGSMATLPTTQTDSTQTLLSAAITNIQTCLDGLQETSSSVKTSLLAPLTNGSMSYSVSLALFKRGWGAAGRHRKISSSTNYDRILNGGRKLLQKVGINANVNQMVVVDPNGKGDFTSINDAVAAAPNNTAVSNGYYVISIAAGVYQEYVNIPINKMYVMMVGAGINKTIITGNRSVVDGWTTYSSATFVVTGQGFVAQKITFRNTAGAVKHQAVALRSGADLSAFYQCSFEGYQDTLYTHSMRQFYKKCDIYGTVDFIFGNAAVVFQNCNIYPRLPMPGQFNSITAQGRIDINQNTGTSIQNCILKAAPDLASSNGTIQTYLGRPWQNYSRTIVMQSFLDNVINPAGWTPWSGNQSLDTLYYAEFNNKGPGSVTTNRVKWPGFHLINATDAANFTVSSFIQGTNWLPTTGVAFASGLKV
ncbi:OLC1v1001938C5 [Oldenlandia corymbosa var. corymbosa]|uniref:Pectinesterase n=1 Tax=Oldenlandia corymbosa var. corymbosa TaxID=529605 RepID=A0AAV1D8R8_OLDCO|nr:OLC1v1001938C5 [Oldenlandia corymbosa var. corymbosa]